MTDVLTTIDQDLRSAQLQKAAERVLVLRGIKSALLNAAIAKRPDELSSDDQIRVLRSEVKRRRDAAQLYQNGGRGELAEKELAEVVIIEHYLPAQLDADAIRPHVQAVVAELGVSGVAATGKVMAAVMLRLGGQADGSAVSAIVREVLSQ